MVSHVHDDLVVRSDCQVSKIDPIETSAKVSEDRRWCCRATEGDLWPDEIAERLVLDICDTIEAMEMLADAGQLKRLDSVCD